MPEIVEELFEERPLRVNMGDDEATLDFVLEAGGRQWAFEVKASSGPGVVAEAAEQLHKRAARVDALPVLVVPYMTPRGASAAETLQLNWIDLSGNASLRADRLRIWVQGRPNRFAGKGRPSSAFAPKSSRVTRTLLLSPTRWWRQKELAKTTDLNPGQVSRIVRRLDDERLLEREGQRLRPLDRNLLLDAWANDYHFDRHDIVTGHFSGSGVGLARELDHNLSRAMVRHAFTGLPAAWAYDKFAQFRLVSIYVAGDPRAAADTVGLRLNARGANVQLIGPDDQGVFEGQEVVDGLLCVSRLQLYLDLQHLPERASEAAEALRDNGGLWRG